MLKPSKFYSDFTHLSTPNLQSRSRSFHEVQQPAITNHCSPRMAHLQSPVICQSNEMFVRINLNFTTNIRIEYKKRSQIFRFTGFEEWIRHTSTVKSSRFLKSFKNLLCQSEIQK